MFRLLSTPLLAALTCAACTVAPGSTVPLAAPDSGVLVNPSNQTISLDPNIVPQISGQCLEGQLVSRDTSGWNCVDAAAGPMGATGAAGATGATGATGAQGQNGASEFWNANTQTGTSYTLALGDALGDGGVPYLAVGNPSPVTVTVPENASTPFPIGSVVTLTNSNTGLVSIAGASGVTINSYPSGYTNLAGQYAIAKLVKTDTDTWLLSGDIGPPFIQATWTNATATTDVVNGSTFQVLTFKSGDTFTITAGAGNVDCLVVGGGGGGAATFGGGGAGGLVYKTPCGFYSAGAYTVTVGSGGIPAVYSGSANAMNGSDSSFGSVVAKGGGAGGFGSGNVNGAPGGSGGGGGAAEPSTPGAGGGTIPGDSAQQGFAGGQGNTALGSGGGGGGAGGMGANATSNGAGNGGAGVAIAITGTAQYFASGGGGGSESGISGSASPGGGGNGSVGAVAAVSGSPNTGGGGGGSFQGAAGNGGSGVVILRYRIQ